MKYLMQMYCTKKLNTTELYWCGHSSAYHKREPLYNGCKYYHTVKITDRLNTIPCCNFIRMIAMTALTVSEERASWLATVDGRQRLFLLAHERVPSHLVRPAQLAHFFQAALQVVHGVIGPVVHQTCQQALKVNMVSHAVEASSTSSNSRKHLFCGIVISALK